MRYVNNWLTQLTGAMSAASTSLPIPGAALDRLPAGSYLLTMANSANSMEQTAWEVIGVTVAGGVATVIRAREETTARPWPAGTLIYCGVTAGTLNHFTQAIDSLAARVTALEGGGGGDPEPEPEPEPSDGALVDASGNVLTDQSGNTLIPAA